MTANHNDFLDYQKEQNDREQAERECDRRDEYNDEYNDEWGDEQQEEFEEPWDGFMTDAEADADVLRSCGWGTEEDYGYYGGNEDY